MKSMFIEWGLYYAKLPATREYLPTMHRIICLLKEDLPK